MYACMWGDSPRGRDLVLYSVCVRACECAFVFTCLRMCAWVLVRGYMRLRAFFTCIWSAYACMRYAFACKYVSVNAYDCEAIVCFSE